MKLEFQTLKDLLVFNIKYYRYVKDISQERLAELCSLSSRYITDIERGMHCPTINKLGVIADALGVEPSVLLQNPTRDKDIIDRMKSSRQYNQK